MPRQANEKIHSRSIWVGINFGLFHYCGHILVNGDTFGAYCLLLISFFLQTNSDFDAKPMVMLLGQYSTGKTTFIKHLLKCSYPGNSLSLSLFFMNVLEKGLIFKYCSFFFNRSSHRSWAYDRQICCCYGACILRNRFSFAFAFDTILVSYWSTKPCYFELCLSFIQNFSGIMLIVSLTVHSLDLMREVFQGIQLLFKQTCHLVVSRLLAQHFCQNFSALKCHIL